MRLERDGDENDYKALSGIKESLQEELENIKSSYMKSIFSSKANVKVYCNGIVVWCHKTNNSCEKCIIVTVFGPKIGLSFHQI